jgi:hypothetical protein
MSPPSCLFTLGLFSSLSFRRPLSACTYGNLCILLQYSLFFPRFIQIWLSMLPEVCVSVGMKQRRSLPAVQAK